MPFSSETQSHTGRDIRGSVQLNTQTCKRTAYLLVRLATDLLGDVLREPPSSRPRGEPAADEEAEEDPSSPADPELEPELRNGRVREEEEVKKDWELEFSLYMETGLVRVGEPPEEPT